ncbi:hypothetical protein N6H05_18850 [Sphingobium sp. WTD-1]|uniref:hypothetical protein n=1 Tax=Sphingobium sp. WTD-1 TaxID=2979467 RepID=UPI0024DE6AA2|nr:hypothetical protein [Sphingobium sp. WTD-1]WIA55076.1 hypothetical protein N6H05_18850 [Sphingobium sp. WTD-1]
MIYEEKDGHHFIEFNARALVSYEKERAAYREAVAALKVIGVVPNAQYVSEMTLQTIFLSEFVSDLDAASEDYFEYGVTRSCRSSLLNPDVSQYNYRIMFRKKSDAMLFKLAHGGH